MQEINPYDFYAWDRIAQDIVLAAEAAEDVKVAAIGQPPQQWSHLYMGMQVLANLMNLPLEWCDAHSVAMIILEEGHGPGFSGAPIFWAKFSCGCEYFDGSQDTLAACE